MKTSRSVEIPGLPHPVSRLIGGTAGLSGGGRRGREAFRSLDLAVEAGCNAFDTARVYRSEAVLGAWMRERSNRERLVLITKGGHPSLITARPRLDPGSIDADLRRSLERLGTGTVDVYLLHRDAENADVEGLLRCLEEHRSAGRLRIYGASNWRHERIEQARSIAARIGASGFAVSSPQFGLCTWSGKPPWRGVVGISGDRGAEARRWYRENGMPVLAWSPLSHRDARFERAREIGSSRGVSPEQVALAYTLRAGMEVLPVVSSSSALHWKQNWEALDLELTPEEIDALESGAP